MSVSHNKKRNSCLVYEFLVRYISSNLVEGNEKKSDAALKILKRHYAPGTELYKEFRLINALINTTVSSESVASSILSEAKSAARSHEPRRLDEEKTEVIHAINRMLSDPDFYDRPVGNYKLLASAQVLVNEWRAGTSADLARVAQYEDAIIRNLTTEKTTQGPGQINEESLGTNRLLFKTMLRKINEKYSGSLTQEQRSLLKAYAFSAANDDDTINKKMNEIKGSLPSLIDRYLLVNKSDEYLGKKLREVKEEVLGQDVSATDENLTKFMLYAKLKTELSTGDDR